MVSSGHSDGHCLELGAQVAHLRRCMQDVEACSLRFTVYTRDEEGRIVELLNTGMLGITSFEEKQQVVLDFEDDVRHTFARVLLLPARPPPVRGLRLLLVLAALALASLL